MAVGEQGRPRWPTPWVARHYHRTAARQHPSTMCEGLGARVYGCKQGTPTVAVAASWLLSGTAFAVNGSFAVPVARK